MNIETPTKIYHKSDKIVYSCLYHVIFCTKYRKLLLQDTSVQNRTKTLFNNVAQQHNFSILEMEVLSDHVHLLLDVNPRLGICKCIKYLKGITSKILREEYPFLKSKAPCLWTSSYFVSSVGAVSLEVVKKYIEDQKKV